MIYTAAWLAAAGYPSYYEHVERYARNMLRNAQFFATDAYESLYRDVHADKSPDAVEEQLGMIRGLQGGFVASPTPNDLVDSNLKHHGADGHPSMLLDLMGCCPPEGMRALRTVWRHTVTSRGSDVFVNMALPCEHEEASVTTSLPGQGTHSVVARRAGSYYIRPPEWAPREDVGITRNGAAVEPTWKSDYVLVSRVTPGERISVTYPLPSFVQHVDLTKASANSGSYSVAWVGNTVTGIEPDGRFLPLFGEHHMPPFPG
jgi:hypothetical protein